MLREHLHIFTEAGYRDVGVYIEWGSCFQPPRTLPQAAAYQRSRKLASLWFAHALTTCCLCVEVPPGEIPVAQRGWNAFEASISWLLKAPVQGDDEWAYVYELHNEESVSLTTKPAPPGPDAFASPHGPLCGLPFALDAEKWLASKLLNETVQDALGSLRELDYARMGWEDEQMDQLGVVLPICTAVERLLLSGNELLTRLPAEIGTLVSLRTLFLHGCVSLLALPETLGRCSRLQTLFLTGCKNIELLPDSICELRHLRDIDVSRCVRLRALPERLSECRTLEALMLTGCESLKGLPERLPPLRALHACGCRSLVSLPEAMTTAPPQLLLSPISAHSSSIALTIRIRDESLLQDLFLYGCSALARLPSSLDSLINLTTLDLGLCSSLTTLPPAVGSLPKLRRLNLHGCSAIEELPPFDGLKLCLEELDLSGCRSLRALPDGLEEMQELHTLNTDGCLLLPIGVRMTEQLPPVSLTYRTHDAAKRAGLKPLKKLERFGPSPV